ncbi:MAG: sacsin N-terminal ATP-binding-like domain-containing protein [Mycobacteriales bacterium]
MDPADPFDIAALRRRVLDAWADSPTRFREDANIEEDFALGGYRDRLLVELAQNAADAAARAGVPGVLRLRLDGGVLTAANTGAPLDAAGVESLASMRASAKREGGTVGRFGVGFAAVLAVTDRPRVISTSGGVEFSAERTREAVAGLPSLAAEYARRDGHVPVLRLCWPVAGEVPAGFATEVRLPLREGAEPAVRAALDALPADLLLALPGLTRIEVGDRVLERSNTGDENTVIVDGVPWHQVTRSGTLPAALLADRPTEERERAGWAVTWAVPAALDLDRRQDGRQVVHAPTPTDEPLSVPARLIATFPLDPDRRHVPPGPLTDWLVERATEAYAELVTTLVDRRGAGPEVLALVPAAGLAAAPLDAALSAGILNHLRAAAWLPAAAGGLVAPAAPGSRAAVLDVAPDAAELLAGRVDGLLGAEWSARRHQPALDALGVRRLGAADVVELVTGADQPPDWWRRLYAALAEVPDRDALGALPVPLADGRLVTGPRGLMLADEVTPELARQAARLDLRLVHPEAAHPLLERLGAQPATARTMLEAVRPLVEASLDDPEADAEPVADAVLALVAAARPAPGELPWLADLALPGADGDLWAAGDLALPPFADVMAAGEFGRPAPELVARWGMDVLAAAGVLRGFELATPDGDPDEPADLDEIEALDLPDIDGWTGRLGVLAGGSGSPVLVYGFAGVRDLDLVADWPAALELLPRAAVTRPVTYRTADGETGEFPSYTSWWLGRNPVLDGRRPRDLRLPSATDLAGLYDPAPPGDPGWLRALGCHGRLADVLAHPEEAAQLLERLGDPERQVPARLLTGLYARLADALAGTSVPPPDLVRTAPARVTPADRAYVLDLPHLLPLLGERAPVPCPPAAGPAVADLLDLPLASELDDAAVLSTPGYVLDWADVPGIALALDRLELDAPPASRLAVHAPLLVSGDLAVPWWHEPDTDHVDHAAGTGALARALSWRAGRWSRRAAVAEALTHPDQATRLRAEDAAG